jgi:hypothetical protein
MARASSSEEKLTDTNIAKVIRLLEAEKPITKKDACAILNISYNTTRLSSIIEKYKEKKEAEKARRAAKRGKPATFDEIQYITESYLSGETIDTISKTISRNPLFVKAVIEKYGVPKRKSSPDYFNPELIPESAVRTRFSVGEKVHSARYDSMATILAEYTHKDGFVYRLWLEDERWQQFAYQPAWELASLEHLREIGIKL